MKEAGILMLLARLNEIYKGAVSPYGTSPYGTPDEVEDGTTFRVAGIAATFSVIRPSGIEPGRYDVQIESYPPGEYIYTDELTLEAFLSLIEEYRRPMNLWRSAKWLDE